MEKMQGGDDLSGRTYFLHTILGDKNPGRTMGGSGRASLSDVRIVPGRLGAGPTPPSLSWSPERRRFSRGASPPHRPFQYTHTRTKYTSTQIHASGQAELAAPALPN